MQTRLFVFCHEMVEPPKLKFAVIGDSCLADVGDKTLDEFAESNSLVRHPSFDWAVGDGGRVAALFESKEGQLPGVIKTKNINECQWMTFPEAARKLKDGTDRRFLQLAVQFISMGGVDNSVIASDYDGEFLQTLKDKLEEKN